jgi:UDP-N-acetylmuramate dehydrogenase
MHKKIGGLRSIESSEFSYYRTTHYFEQYGDFSTVGEFHEYCCWAKANNIKIYILGNGSNTLFARKKITTLILKNNLSKYIKELPDNRFEISSSTLVIDVLKYCCENSLNSFYYLASVPATVGGALAMNAGRGKQHNLTIYDFVEAVNYYDTESNSIKTIDKNEAVIGYRETIFTGIKSKLILSAIFEFEKINLDGNPIMERCKWSKQFQDYSAPNCGSVFKESSPSILNRLKGLSIAKASFSAKTNNWILNRAASSFPIMNLIAIAKFLHVIVGKKASLEVITVD